jgi:AAA+ superfamily predicted ATPase
MFLINTAVGLFTIVLLCLVVILIKIHNRNVEEKNTQKVLELLYPQISEEPIKAQNTVRKNNISEIYFNTINDAANNLVDFYNTVKNDKDLEEVLSRHLEQRNGVIELSSQVYILFCLDLKTCYTQLGHNVYLKSKEGLGFLIFIIRAFGGLPPIQYYQLDTIRDDAETFQDNLAGLLESASVSGDVLNCFLLADLLGVYDEYLQKKYLVLLYRFASIIAKADGTVSETEEKWLSELLQLSDNTVPTKSESNTISNAHPQEELQSLIGLDSVKSEITTLVNFIKIQQARQEKGLKSSQLSYHCVFTGNPGTGKTTVARIVAEVYKELGILQKGHLVETDRSGLVAEYVGQTAVKTNKIINSALDGVLFIDEAYSLVSGGNEDYGKEAIATLLKRMEDNRDRLIVILAGYSNEMKVFIDSNPGLQSRFNRYIDFPDYSTEELYQIFELNLRKFDYTISNETSLVLKAYLSKVVSQKSVNFGNARFVRNFFEKTLERQANRLAKETNLTTEKLTEICVEDIIEIKKL